VGLTVASVFLATKNMPSTEISTLLTLLDGGSQRSPTALLLPDPLNQTFSYPQLKSSALLFRDALRHQLGVRIGDVVAMSLVNSVEFVIGFMGTGIAR
jgi:oxalate---CoA ligase